MTTDVLCMLALINMLLQLGQLRDQWHWRKHLDTATLIAALLWGGTVVLAWQRH